MRKRTKTEKWKRNVKLYYGFRVLCTMQFIMPIFMLFLIDKGLTSFQIFITQAAYTMMELLLTVPSGAFADKAGRKKTLIISTALFSGAFVAYSFAQNFVHVLLAEMVFAVSSAAFHGTGEAFLYDTLAEAKREKQYRKVLGTAYAIQSIVMAVSALAGGWMASMDLSLPFLLSALPTGLSLIPLMLLDEPKRKKAQQSSYAGMVKDAAAFVAEHRKVRNIMYYVGVTSLAGFMGFMLYQPILTNKGLSLEYLGLFMMGLSAAHAVGNKLAHRFEKKMKDIDMMFLLAGSRALLYLLLYLADGYYLMAWALLVDLVAGVSTTLVPEWVNRHAREENRATVLSLTSMSGCLTFSLFSPLLGLYADAYTPQACYLLLALMLFAYAARQLGLMLYARSRKKT